MYGPTPALLSYQKRIIAHQTRTQTQKFESGLKFELSCNQYNYLESGLFTNQQPGLNVEKGC